jgi:PhzF family phenazine biosynthesis protein
LNPKQSKMKTYIVDSFTTEIFKGNPAGVCLIDKEVTEKQMLLIAQELNLSETAFVKTGKAVEEYFIRYFSPKMEIPLCGHATLAAAKVLFEKENLSTVHFVTGQALRLAVKKSDHQIEMEFPVYQTVPAQASDALIAALGLSSIVNCAYNAETNILLLEISDTVLLANLTPDFEALYKAHDSINGVLVTAASCNDEYDFHSRYFWPWSGTNEDPVTGGTHTFLGKYWADKLHTLQLKSFQSSARTGFMEVELISSEKLLIRGNAICILEGELRL